MFIGYPRSGHSLIGSLLDAHPNIIIAHELHALKYLFAGFKKNQIFYLLLKNSRDFTKAGRWWNGYSYIVPNQFQGRFKKLIIIGDKKGDRSAKILQTYPDLLKQFRNVININIRLLYVVRNPYDNITTIFKKQKKGIKESIDYYFSLSETIASVKEQLNKDEFFELRHEAFIDNPKKLLKEICLFLGVEAPEDYLTDCESIVFKSPRITRGNLPWDDELVAKVKERMTEFSFLEGYSYQG